MAQKNIWNISTEELMMQHQVTKEGLTSQQVDRIRQEKGENILQEGKKKSIFQVFISQFADLLVVILIVAAVISMFSGNVESTIVILLVLVMNAVLGTVQHVKAQRSLESLKQLLIKKRWRYITKYHLWYLLLIWQIITIILILANLSYRWKLHQLRNRSKEQPSKLK